MAITNHERVGKALDLLAAGLEPYVEQRLAAKYGAGWLEEVREDLPHHFKTSKDGEPHWDSQALIGVMWKRWNEVFSSTLGQAERSLLVELREVRNNWAHQKTFSGDDAYRALDSIARLLTATSATQADEVERQKKELLRQRFDEQVRNEKRKGASSIEGTPVAHLKPWRELITPHPDVASGRYQQAEFAADLWQVYSGEGSDEYRDPVEFFRRTYLTEGLSELLRRSMRRLANNGGDPVVELQTNFGGGKTHSMLALYHLFSGTPAEKLPGLEELIKKEGVRPPAKVHRAVLVGTKLSPGQPRQKKDGTVVRTLWGEIAWQLGGREAYDMIRQADETGTNPGDAMETVFRKFTPCLILIDEWVAYARQLYGNDKLPSGSFDTHFTFAQSLSESAKVCPNTLLIVSIPASDNEIGGDGGKQALSRLKNAIGRVESPWRPASTEEGYEIVRRRLFQPITEPDKFTLRDAVVNAFGDLYRTHAGEFPSECREVEYERKMKAAYPIHPELFTRLFEDWSELDKFQRTRGVLRLMAAVIHSLWEKEDRSLMILPSSIPVDDPYVTEELTRYLEDQWRPVIEKDIDGPDSLPLKMDRENPNFGRYSASRRVARTLYLGSAPTQKAANKGLEDSRIKLGCVQPGESSATFGDALRRLSDRATYLFVNQQRYWYSTQPTVTRLAQDRAQQFHQDAVWEEIKNRLQEDSRTRGEFARVHACPATTGDVPDEQDARLVILGPEHIHQAKAEDSPAIQFAGGILRHRGNSPRSYQNTLVFLAADKARLEELEQSVRQFLAWKSIDEEHNELNLDAYQRTQATTKKKSEDNTVNDRILETYCWYLAPCQPDPKVERIEWGQSRLQGAGPLGPRASKKAVSEQSLYRVFAGSLLRMELDKIPLWRGDHVLVKQLTDDFARYLYLPRLKSTTLLFDAIMDGVISMVADIEGFAYAEGYDEENGRYRGLKLNHHVIPEPNGLVVKNEVATHQRDREYEETRAAREAARGNSPEVPGPVSHIRTPAAQVKATGATPQPVAKRANRYHGSVKIDPMRINKEVGKVVEEVIQHLTGLPKSRVRISLEIEAEVPDGVPDNAQRTIIENGRTLNFDPGSGFEVE